jgi:hypothetical protein
MKHEKLCNVEASESPNMGPPCTSAKDLGAEFLIIAAEEIAYRDQPR